MKLPHVLLLAGTAIVVTLSLGACSTEDFYDPDGFCFIGSAPTQQDSEWTMSSDETRSECDAWAAREGGYVIRWEAYD